MSLRYSRTSNVPSLADAVPRTAERGRALKIYSVRPRVLSLVQVTQPAQPVLCCRLLYDSRGDVEEEA